MSFTGHECPRCGSLLDEGTSEGLCPACVWASLLVDGLEDDDLSPASGTRRLGDFEVGELIARGGMGAVYRARQVSLNRVVALKILSPAEAEGPDFRERFRIEAAAAASLSHPNIVAVYGFGQQAGEYFLAMQYIAGGSLRREETSGRKVIRKPSAAAKIVAKVARAVHFAHQRGILHRDLKPGNILLDELGEPVLADFGLAKAMTGDAFITMNSALLGTPAYMAPEQARGQAREITVAADVYGLGAVLYDLLADRPPAQGATPLETLRAVVESEPERPSLLNPAVDRDLETICLKCLEKESARRYASAAALADDLECWMEGRPIQARPAGALEWTLKWMRRHRTLSAISVVAIAGLLGVTAVSVAMNIRLSAAQRVISAQAEQRRRELVALHVATGTRLAEDGDPVSALLSFAEAAGLEAGRPERVRAETDRFALAMGDAPALQRELMHPAAVRSVSFDPQGDRLLTACDDGAARLWSPQSGALLGTPVSNKGPLHWAGFSPDGRILAVGATNGVITLHDPETGRMVAGPWKGAPYGGLRTDIRREPMFSPDGHWCAAPVGAGMVLCDLSRPSPTQRVLEISSRVNHVFFSPDSSEMVLALEKGGAEVRNVETLQVLRVLGPEVPWRNGAWSPDATQIALMSRGFWGRIFSLRGQNAPVSAILKHGDVVVGCVYSPDGKRLLTWSYDNFARLFDCVSGGYSGTPLRHGGPLTAAAFSPDGQIIATASADGFVRLLTSQTFLSLGARLPLGAAVSDVVFSPDGRRLAASCASGRVRVWTAPDGDLSYRRWNCGSPANSVAFSPSGANVAAVGLQNTVRVWNVESGLPLCDPLIHPSRAGEIGWLDEKRLITMCVDQQFRIWKLPEGTIETVFPMPPNATGHLAGHILVTKPKDRDAEIWDAATGRRQAVLKGTINHFVKLSADGRLFLTINSEAVEVRTVAEPQTLLLHRKTERGGALGAFDLKAERIAIAYYDFSIDIVEIAGGRLVAGPLRHQSAVRDLAFTPDGRALASASDDATLRIWDIATGEPLSPPFWHENRAIRLDVRYDGRAFATASSDGFARIWQIPKTPQDPVELKRLARRLNAIGD